MDRHLIFFGGNIGFLERYFLLEEFFFPLSFSFGHFMEFWTWLLVWGFGLWSCGEIEFWILGFCGYFIKKMRFVSTLLVLLNFAALRDCTLDVFEVLSQQKI